MRRLVFSPGLVLARSEPLPTLVGGFLGIVPATLGLVSIPTS